MPKLIAHERKLRTVGRKLVTDAAGAPCCCDEPPPPCPLWRRVDNCALASLQRWICNDSTCVDGSNVTAGKVVEIDNDCWRVTLVTNANPPVHLRIQDRVFPCFPDCNTCDPPPGNLCCDQNGGECGLWRPNPPRVFFEATLRVNSFSTVYKCPPSCGLSVWPYPWQGTTLSGRSTFPGGTTCTDISPNVNTTRQFSLSNPCGGGSFAYSESLSHGGEFSLVTGSRFNSPVPIGTANANEVCIGTSSLPSSPSIGGRLFVQNNYAPAGVLQAIDVDNLQYAISVRDPTQWWLYFRKAGANPSMTGSVGCPGNCDARAAIAARINWTLRPLCDGNQIVVPQMVDISATAWCDGITTCSGAKPGGGRGPSVPLSGGPRQPGPVDWDAECGCAHGQG